MKKHISLVFTLALLMAVSFGCKVGADDPATMASRDGRLVRTWMLTGVEGTETGPNFFGTVETTTTAFNGTIVTVTTTPGSAYTYSYTLELVIDKGGILTATETVDGDITTETTYWSWGNTDKNKSMLSLWSGSMAGGTWDVLGLSSKALTLTLHSKQIDVNSGVSSSDESMMKLTFEAK